MKFFNKVICCFIFGFALSQLVGCPPQPPPNSRLSESDIRQVKPGMAVKTVNQKLGQNIDPKTLSIQLVAQPVKKNVEQNTPPQQPIHFLIRFKNGKVTSVERLNTQQRDKSREASRVKSDH